MLVAHECGGDGCGGVCGVCGEHETCGGIRCDLDEVDFAGGTLADLRAIRPTLDFGRLVISGRLEIPSSERSVTIEAEELRIAASGAIDVVYPICSTLRRNGPNLSLLVTGAAVIDGAIDVAGGYGERTTSSSSCRSCYGGDGGDVLVRAASINLRQTGGIFAHGGSGSNNRFTTTAANGCDGGDGGAIRFEAPVVRSRGACMKVLGGRGGIGLDYGADGDPGVNGSYAAGAGYRFTEPETEINYATVDSNREACVASTGATTLIGRTYQDDDLAARTAADSGVRNGTVFMTYDSGFRDFIEDLFFIPVAATSTVSATATFSGYDLDLFLFRADDLALMAVANGTASPESFSVSVPAGEYFLGVSYADDGASRSSSMPYEITLDVD